MRRLTEALFFSFLFLVACRNPATSRTTQALGGNQVTGTWTGSFYVGDSVTPRSLTLQLHQLDDDSVIGYVLGGTQYRVLVDGDMANGVLDLTLRFTDPLVTRTYTLQGGSVDFDDGVIIGNFHGSCEPTNEPTPGICPSDEDNIDQLITLTRTTLPYNEVHYVFGYDDGGLSSPIDVAIVFDESGNFLNGGWVGEQDCAFFACGGGVDSYSNTEQGVSIGLNTGGGCPGTGTLLVQSSSNIYSGTVSFSFENNCESGKSNASVIGARAFITMREDAADILSTFGQLANDVHEYSGTTGAFVAPYDPFSMEYLHNGVNLSGMLKQLNAEVESHSSIRLRFGDFRNMKTVLDSDIPYYFDPCPGSFCVDFRDMRYADGVTTPYVDYDSTDIDTVVPIDDHEKLRFLDKTQDAGWQFYGNQENEDFLLDLPFDASALVYPISFQGIWPFGVHGGGHQDGHYGIDFDLTGQAVLVAPHTGTISRIESNAQDPGGDSADSLQFSTGIYDVRFAGVSASSVLLEEGDVVGRGELLGAPGRPSPNILPSYYYVHYAVSIRDEQYQCPLDVSTETARSVILNYATNAYYAEQMTEPYVCNDIMRGWRSNEFCANWIYTTQWAPSTGTALNPLNPAMLTFSRKASDGSYAFDMTDQMGTSRTGLAQIAFGTVGGFHTIDLTLDGGGIIQGLYAIEPLGHDPRKAVLKLSLGAVDGFRPSDLTDQDSYLPSVVDDLNGSGPSCP